MRTVALYVWVLVREFRWTLVALLAVVGLGTVLVAITPQAGVRPAPGAALYAAWMALLGQQVVDVAGAWPLMLVDSKPTVATT